MSQTKRYPPCVGIVVAFKGNTAQPHVRGVISAGGWMSTTQPAQLYVLEAAQRVCDSFNDAWTTEAEWSLAQVIPIVTATADKVDAAVKDKIGAGIIAYASHDGSF